VVGDDDLYTMADLTQTFDTIDCVTVKPTYRIVVPGTREVRALIRSNASEAESAAFASGLTYRTMHGVFETNPDGGGAWDSTAVDALECGITIES
jgi:hypothetical protein